MSWEFTARFDGNCFECGGRFPAGTPIRYDDGGNILHANLSDCTVAEVDRRPDERTPCKICFCYHVGECI